MKIESQNAAQTKEIARQYSSRLHGGDILGLQGDLGSGKTTFIQGLAEGLNIKGPVTSPTFIFLRIYPVCKHKNIKHLCHIDAYRITNIQDAISTGITDFLGKKDILCVIEWPENIGAILPQNIKRIFFRHINETTREIIIAD